VTCKVLRPIRRKFISLSAARRRGRCRRGRNSPRKSGASVCLCPFCRNWVAAFVQGLQQSGWTDGRNIRIDYRWSAGDADLIRKLAMEMIALGPDVMAPHR
jgi:hypothetical protein